MAGTLWPAVQEETPNSTWLVELWHWLRGKPSVKYLGLTKGVKYCSMYIIASFLISDSFRAGIEETLHSFVAWTYSLPRYCVVPFKSRSSGDVSSLWWQVIQERSLYDCIGWNNITYLNSSTLRNIELFNVFVMQAKDVIANGLRSSAL